MRPRTRGALSWLALLAMLAAATSPVWRLLVRGDAATVDELLQLRCGARAAAATRR